VRKRCKKIRGAFRLIRDQAEEVYHTENRWFRDTARLFSAARNAGALWETVESLADRYSHEINRTVIDSLLCEMKKQEEHKLSQGAYFKNQSRLVQTALLEGRLRLDSLSLHGDGSDCVAGGLKKTYKRLIRQLRAMKAQPAPEAMHALRKRVKYHGYHLRLLREIHPEILKSKYKEVHQISRLLGEHHNLILLEETLKKDESLQIDDGFRLTASGFIRRRLAEIEHRYRPLSQRSFIDTPKQLLHEINVCWQAARVLQGSETQPN
jgi:hypothetical protein